MKLSKLYSKSLWKDSFLYAVSFIAAIETICAIANFSITDICNIQKWWEKGLVIVGVFLLFWLIISVVKAFRADHSITLKIKGINVKIEEGDIFESTDWKLIPFNEFFDPAEGEGWIDRYNSHDGFSQGIRSYSDIIGSSPIYKTAIVMVIYVAVCVLLGVFLLRNKNKVPKPYMRDQYKRQLVVAKENSQDAKVTNVVDVTPTAVATDNVEEVKESTNLETTESVTKEDAEVIQTQDETNASEELNNTANLEETVEETPKDVEANLNNKE